MKRILITGASSGLGLGLAEECLERGDRVFAIQRRSSPLLGRAHFSEICADLTSVDEIPGRLSSLLDGVELLDLVILNAGRLGTLSDISSVSIEELQVTLDINTWANKALLDALFARAMRIDQVVGISSGAAVSGSRGWSGYAISKAALLMLLKLYAAERSQTHFCSLAPGLVDTAMQDYLCGLDAEAAKRFPSVARIQAARGTDKMPGPRPVARRLLTAVDAVRQEPSGAFLDIRTMKGL